MMGKHFARAAGVALILLIGAAAGWSDITVNFEGGYNFGLYDWWKWETDGWGMDGSPLLGEIRPGRGDTGSAQGVGAYDGSHYVLKTMEGLQPGLTYRVSVWIRTFRGDGSIGTISPAAWVEFGWDRLARDTTQPNSNLLWNVEPKFDYANNMGNWVQYIGEPFMATGTSITVAFKVGNIQSNNPYGIQAHFDDLEILQVTAPIDRYQFPDDFNTTYSIGGAADGWVQRFIPGGDTPRWAEAPGRGTTGSAQRLYAAPEAAGLGINIGAVKVFDITPGLSHNMTLWVSASDSSGSALTNPNPDPGPIVKFGLDLTAQNTDPLAESVQWNTEPTGVFSTPGQENTWRRFSITYFRPTSDTVSVWLWVEGDYNVGVDAKFDDLDVDQNLDLRRWELYP